MLFTCTKCGNTVKKAGKRVDQVQKLCGYCASLKKGTEGKREERPLAWDFSKTKEWLTYMASRVVRMTELYDKNNKLTSIELLNLTKD